MDSSDKNKNDLFLGFIGPRVLKTIIAVFICFTLAYLRDAEPFYSVIATIICMKSNYDEGFEAAKSRMVSTFVGGLFGTITIITLTYINADLTSYGYYILLTILLIPIIYICVNIGYSEATYLSCVLFLIITITRSHDQLPFYFVIRRTLETIIGIIVSLVVNNTISI